MLLTSQRAVANALIAAVAPSITDIIAAYHYLINNELFAIPFSDVCRYVHRNIPIIKPCSKLALLEHCGWLVAFTLPDHELTYFGRDISSA